jgi:hypothetical protein
MPGMGREAAVRLMLCAVTGIVMMLARVGRLNWFWRMIPVKIMVARVGPVLVQMSLIRGHCFLLKNDGSISKSGMNISY